MSNTNGQIGNGDQNQQQVIKPVERLKIQLEAPSVQDQFKNALDDNAGTFVASLIDLFGSDDYLQKCDPKLVIMEALKAAILKLPILKSLGFAYIVPYNKDRVLVPQFQIGYKGLIQLAMRTNQYRIINADVVYEGEYRSKNKLTGEYDLSGDAKSDKVIGYFAHFEMKNGFSKTLYSTVDKVTAHAKKYSKSYSQPSGPWTKEFDAMATKTVVRGLLGHWGYLSVELLNAMNEDEASDVADRVKDEISNKANRTPMDFSKVEELEPITDNGGPGF